MKKYIFIIFYFSIFIGPEWIKADENINLTLNDAISLAMKNSTALAALKSRINISKKVIAEKWRSFLPDLTLRYEKEDIVSYREDDYRSMAAYIDVGYDIHTCGKTIIEYQISKLESILAMEEYRIERSNIILGVKKIYFEVLDLKKAVEINTMLLKSLRHQASIVKERKDLGLATELEKLQVDSRISEAEYMLLKSANEYENRISDLKTITGCGSGGSIIIDNEKEVIKEIPGLKYDKEKFISFAVNRRSEFLKSRYELLKSEKEMQLAEFYYLPTIKISGSYGLSGDKYPPNKRLWSIGVSVTTAIIGNSISTSGLIGESNNGNTRRRDNTGTFGIYDDPSYLRHIIQSRAEYKTAKQSHSFLYNSISLEVKRAFDSYNECIKKYKVAIDNVVLLEKQVEIEEEKGRLGDVVLYDILKSYLDLAEARFRKSSAYYECLLNRALLERAAGFYDNMLP